MAFATGNFTTKPTFRLEQAVNVIGWEPIAGAPGTYNALVEVIVGIRRMSGALTDSGTGTIAVGFGGGGESKPFTYNFAATDYVQIYRATWKRATTMLADNWSATANPTSTLGTATATVGPMTYPAYTAATQPSFTPNPFTAGTSITVALPRTNATYTHDVLYSFGALVDVQLATGVGTTYSTTPPVTLGTQIPNAPEGPYTITAVTRTSAGVEVGRLSFTGTLRMPSSEAPTVTAYAVSDTNATVAAQVGTFVQGLSVLRLDSVTATAKQGATIVDRRLSIEGQSLPTSGTRALLLSGSIPIVAQAWDSRGLQGQLAGNVNVLQYSPPVVGTVLPAAPSGSVYRSTAGGVYDPNGQNITFKLLGDVASLINGTEKNTFTVRISTRPFDSSVWTVRNTVTPSTTTSGGRIRAGAQNIVVGGGAIYLNDNSYVVRVEVYDKFNAVVSDTTISTSFVTIDLNGQYIGVGKLHQRGTADVGGEGYFRGVYTTYQFVASANNASWAGSFYVDSTTTGMPAGIPAVPYFLRVDRFVAGGGVEGVVQYLSPITDPDRVIYTRSAFASLDTAVVSWDPWVARGQAKLGFGTDAQRLALPAGSLFDGLHYWTTDTSIMWRRISGAWQQHIPGTPWAVATGVGTTPAGGSLAVTFPAGRFNVAPTVTVTSTSARFTTISAGPTTTGFTCLQTTAAGAAAAGTFNWQAIQMTPTSATG